MNRLLIFANPVTVCVLVFIITIQYCMSFYIAMNLLIDEQHIFTGLFFQDAV